MANVPSGPPGPPDPPPPSSVTPAIDQTNSQANVPPPQHQSNGSADASILTTTIVPVPPTPPRPSPLPSVQETQPLFTRFRSLGSSLLCNAPMPCCRNSFLENRPDATTCPCGRGNHAREAQATAPPPQITFTLTSPLIHNQQLEIFNLESEEGEQLIEDDQQIASTSSSSSSSSSSQQSTVSMNKPALRQPHLDLADSASNSGSEADTGKNGQSKSRTKKTPNSRTFSIESYFYAEMKPTKENPTESGQQPSNSGSNKRGPYNSSSRSRSKSAQKSTTNGEEPSGGPPGPSSATTPSLDLLSLPTTKVDSIFCPDCGHYLKVKDFANHIWDRLWARLPGTADSPVANLCKHCLQVFDTEESLKEHFLIINTKFAKNSCLICMKSFPTDDDLFTHMRTTHVRHSMPYFCTVDACQYRSSTSAQFLAHYDERHPYPLCHLCFQHFPDGDHLFINGFNSPWARQSETVRLYTTILNHYQAHLMVGRTYACDFCSLTFADAVSVVAHCKGAHSNLKIPQSKNENSGPTYKKVELEIEPEERPLVSLYDEATFKRKLGTIVLERNRRELDKMLTKKSKTTAGPSSSASPDDEDTLTASEEQPSSSGDVTLSEANASMLNESIQVLFEAPPERVRRLAEVAEFNSGVFQLNREAASSEGPGQARVVLKEGTSAEFASLKISPSLFQRAALAGKLPTEILSSAICNECNSPVLQPSKYLTEASGRHYVKGPEPLRCRVEGCGLSTFCADRFVRHYQKHKSASTFEAPLMSNWALTRNPDEHLIVCMNCEAYFETYEQASWHILKRKHIVFWKSFEEEIQEEKAKRARQQLVRIKQEEEGALEIPLDGGV